MREKTRSGLDADLARYSAHCEPRSIYCAHTRRIPVGIARMRSPSCSVRQGTARCSPVTAPAREGLPEGIGTRGFIMDHARTVRLRRGALAHTWRASLQGPIRAQRSPAMRHKPRPAEQVLRTRGGRAARVSQDSWRLPGRPCRPRRRQAATNQRGANRRALRRRS